MEGRSGLMNATGTVALRHRVYRARRALVRGLLYTLAVAVLMACVAGCVGLLWSALGGFLEGSVGAETSWGVTVVFAAGGGVTGIVIGLVLTVVGVCNAVLFGDRKDKREASAIAEVARFNRWAAGNAE